MIDRHNYKNTSNHSAANSYYDHLISKGYKADLGDRCTLCLDVKNLPSTPKRLLLKLIIIVLKIISFYFIFFSVFSQMTLLNRLLSFFIGIVIFLFIYKYIYLLYYRGKYISVVALTLDNKIIISDFKKVEKEYDFFNTRVYQMETDHHRKRGNYSLYGYYIYDNYNELVEAFEYGFLAPYNNIRRMIMVSSQIK